MELDFSILDTLKTSPQNAPERTKTEPVGKSATDEEKRSEGLSGASERVSLVRLERDKEERARLRETYSQLQENIKASGGLRADILKGARAGVDATTLFLSAVKCISLMTGDTVFSSQIEDDMRAIYGEGLLEPVPLQRQLQEVEERLGKLQHSLTREGISPHDRQRIQNAVQAHQKKREELLGLLRNE